MDLGALPPNPRSLSRGQHPAVSEKDRARLQARSPAVTLADGCSGRTPAEPCPSAGINERKPKTRHRPPTNRLWRRKFPRVTPTSRPDISHGDDCRLRKRGTTLSRTRRHGPDRPSPLIKAAPRRGSPDCPRGAGVREFRVGPEAANRPDRRRRANSHPRHYLIETTMWERNISR
jgi:hypothetical protein